MKEVRLKKYCNKTKIESTLSYRILLMKFHGYCLDKKCDNENKWDCIKCHQSWLLTNYTITDK